MAFDFYFAGSQNSYILEAKKKLNTNELRSYMTERREIGTLMNLKRTGEWRGKLLIDSGAFTIHRKGGEVDVDGYIDWLNKNEDAIDYAIQLDEIPGVWGTPRTAEELAHAPIGTWENYLNMISKLKRPQMLLPVFHQGENFKYLKQMINHKINDNEYVSYICISGNKELANVTREKWYTECFSVIQQSENPKIKVHCLGSATFSNAERFPFTSMDATTWIMVGANGRILTKYGPVLISDKSPHDKDHFNHQPAPVKEYVKEKCKEWNVKYDLLQSDYQERLIFNLYFTHLKSLETKHKTRKFGTRSLF